MFFKYFKVKIIYDEVLFYTCIIYKKICYFLRYFKYKLCLSNNSVSDSESLLLGLAKFEKCGPLFFWDDHFEIKPAYRQASLMQIADIVDR